MTTRLDPSTNIDQTDSRMKYALWAGIAMVCLLPLHFPANNSEKSVLFIFSRIGCGLLIAGASLSAGGFLGFIFGIPNLLQSQASSGSRSAILKYNDNLVQISDWLTKIIVGVSLTQIGAIPGKVKSLGECLKWNFGGDDWGRNASLAVVFYFFLFGFLMIYFWTRTGFTIIMKYVDDDLQQKVDSLEVILKQTDENKQKFEKLADSEVASKTKELVNHSRVASDANSIEQLKKDSTETLKVALDQLKEKVKEVLKNKPVKTKDDLQKGRWGGKAENNGKQISASVSRSKASSFYDISIAVSDKTKGLDVPVAIFIHDSFVFPDDVIYVNPENGVAKVTLTAYEAFTVGALFADDTELELDLNEQKGYPEGFYWVTPGS